MGLRIRNFMAILVLILSLVQMTEAAWQGPNDVISGTWGVGDNQFGIEYGDTNDVFGGPFYILPDGSIILTDLINGRRKVYGSNGILTKLVKCVQGPTGEWNGECRIRGEYLKTTDGSILTARLEYPNWIYSIYSITGDLLKTFTERPAELGVIKERKLAPERYMVTVKYPDKEWTIIGAGVCPQYMRDISGNLYCIGDIGIVRYDESGNEMASLMMPKKITQETKSVPGVESEITVLEEYGSPVLAPNGDVYTWKRTPDRYSIIKWIWE